MARTIRLKFDSNETAQQLAGALMSVSTAIVQGLIKSYPEAFSRYAPKYSDNPVWERSIDIQRIMADGELHCDGIYKKGNEIEISISNYDQMLIACEVFRALFKKTGHTIANVSQNDECATLDIQPILPKSSGAAR